MARYNQMFGAQQHLIPHTERHWAVFSVVRPLLPHLCPLHRLLRTRQCIRQLLRPFLRNLHLVLSAQMVSWDGNRGTIYKFKRRLARRSSNTIIDSKLALPKHIHPIDLMFQNKCTQYLLQCTMLALCLPVGLGMMRRTESKACTNDFHQCCPKC